MRRAAAFVLLAACGSQQSGTAAVTLSTPSSSATIAPPPATTATTTHLCGRTSAPRVPADVAALIAKTSAPPYYEFPPMPPAPVEVVEAAAFEMRDPKVREAFEVLQLSKLREAGARWSIAVALGHRNIDVRINAARMLEEMCFAAHDPSPAAYMVEIARATAVFVPGSEAATLQGIFMHAIADATSECTGAKTSIKDGQDPEGLKAAADMWQKQLCP